MKNNYRSWQIKEYSQFLQKYTGQFAGDIRALEILRLSYKYMGRKVLDIGAGSGALLKLVPDAIGIDIVSKHPRAIEAVISNLPFKSNIFDTVFATEVLEDLDDEKLNKGISEIYRVLKTNGYFVISVPFNEDLNENKIICPKCGEEFHRYGHVHIFDRTRIGYVMNTENFKIILLKILPIEFMAKHRILKYFRYFFRKLGYLKYQSLYVVARKV